MALSIRGYKEILKSILYWKYNLHVIYQDVQFKFRNTGLGNNGASKLTIYGIVPEVKTYDFAATPDATIQNPGNVTVVTGGRDSAGSAVSNTVVPPGSPVPVTNEPGLSSWNPVTSMVLGQDGNPIRSSTGLPLLQTIVAPRTEYVVYTEVRGINLEKWSVRVPQVLGPTPLASWNVLDGVAGIPPGWRLEAGIGYNRINEISLDKFDNKDTIALFESVRSETPEGGGRRLNFRFRPNIRIPIATSSKLSTSIARIIRDYGVHPCIELYNPNSADGANKRFYNLLPLGLVAYRVKLELANGESVQRLFDTSWNPISAVPEAPISSAEEVVLATRGRG